MRPLYSVIAACLMLIFFQQCKKGGDDHGHTTICMNPVFLKDSSFSLLVPTAFTPNGDGRNDLFRIVGSNFSGTEYSVAIYQHNGDLMFYSTNPGQPWDGRDQSGNISTGYLHAVQIRYTNFQNEVRDTCTYLYLIPSGNGCVQAVAQDVANYIFEDQIDPATGQHPYTTGEVYCQ
jgi:gliding motility-associated-like protein